MGVLYDAGCAPIGCDLDELDLVFATLTAAAERVENAAFSTSPECKKGGFVLSYLAIPQPMDWLDSPAEPSLPRIACSAEGCTADAPLRCGGCKGACYCSTTCQTQDWKNRHKLVCASLKASTAAKGAATTSTTSRSPVHEYASTSSKGTRSVGAARKSATLSLEPTAYLHELGDAFSSGMVSIGINYRTGEREVVRDRTEAPLNVHANDEFVVKIQTGLIPGTQPLMIYDETKSINFFLPTSVSSGAELDAFVRSSNQGGACGRKAYLKAVREGDNLRVFFELASIPSW
jgi:hypothetical protein